MDSVAAFKNAQKESWSKFASLEMLTTVPAAQLVSFAGIRSGQRVLDVACGSGVVAITAARLGAAVTGIDLTPELLESARENSAIGGISVDWQEGDVEKLPSADRTFDVVVSQFGHMFAPRPGVALSEMSRVLKRAGTIAFSTWPPDLFMGRMFSLVASYMPPVAEGISASHQWGDTQIVRERLGSAFRDLVFDVGTILAPALTPLHFRSTVERNIGPVIKLVAKFLSENPATLEAFREEFDSLIAQYFSDNSVRLTYLLTRATKA